MTKKLENKSKINLLKKASLKGFTLIEMLIVLLIISVLILLLVPNLSSYREHVNKESREAVLQLVETQKEIFSLQNKGRVPTVDELLKEGYITKEHADIYNQN